MADQYESVKAWFDSAPARFQANRAGGLDTVFQMNITGPGGGQWYLTIKDKTLTVSEGTATNPRLTVTMSAEDWLKVMNRKADGEALYEMGRIRINGSEYLAQQLLYLFT
jgi:putative sterol carrier protein